MFIVSTLLILSLLAVIAVIVEGIQGREINAAFCLLSVVMFIESAGIVFDFATPLMHYTAMMF